MRCWWSMVRDSGEEWFVARSTEARMSSMSIIFLFYSIHLFGRDMSGGGEKVVLIHCVAVGNVVENDAE